MNTTHPYEPRWWCHQQVASTSSVKLALFNATHKPNNKQQTDEQKHTDAERLEEKRLAAAGAARHVEEGRDGRGRHLPPSSRKTTSCCHRKGCLAQSAAWQAEGVREMRSALKNAIRYRDRPIFKAQDAPPRAVDEVAPTARGPRAPRRACACVLLCRCVARAAPAAPVAAIHAPPLADLVITPPPTLAIPGPGPEGSNEPPPFDGPMIFRASKPASTFAAARWANCHGCPGCPRC